MLNVIYLWFVSHIPLILEVQSFRHSSMAIRPIRSINYSVSFKLLFLRSVTIIRRLPAPVLLLSNFRHFVCLLLLSAAADLAILANLSLPLYPLTGGDFGSFTGWTLPSARS